MGQKMKRWEWVTVAAVVLAWGANLPDSIADPIGRWEGRYWPVTASVQITRATEMGDGWVEVYGNSSKSRSCKFRSIDWYIGTPDAHRSAQIMLSGPAVVRPLGPYDFGPWRIQITIDDLMVFGQPDGSTVSASYAELRHACPLFTLFGVAAPKPWETITQVWPGGGVLFTPMEESP